MAKKVTSTVPEGPTEFQKIFEQTKKSNLEKGLIDDPSTDTGLKDEERSQDPDRFYPSLADNYYDKFDDYIERNTLRSRNLSMNDMLEQRAENQSNWEQAGNAVGRVGLNIVPQIISGFASMVDIQGYWDAEHAAQNGIVNWADSLKEHVDQELLPIYEDPHGGPMNLGDPA